MDRMARGSYHPAVDDEQLREACQELTASLLSVTAMALGLRDRAPELDLEPMTTSLSRALETAVEMQRVLDDSATGDAAASPDDGPTEQLG
jgi:hypothetical protein